MPSYPQATLTAPFDLCGGHVALNFVNTLDERFRAEGPLELLRDYCDLLRFVEQSRMLEPSRARALAKSLTPATAARALRTARELREAMAGVLYARVENRPPRAADILTLERRFHDADRHRELRWERSAAPGMAWQRGRFESQAELPVWIVAHAASQLLMSDAVEQVRACGAQTCRWLFLDTSKSHTRRWCNMKICGNRMKARRFHARHATSH